MTDSKQSRVREMWKFQVPISGPAGFAEVEMPAHAAILHADSQNDNVFVWALVNPQSSEKEVRRLGAFPTGGAIPSDGPLFIGTTTLYDGAIVAHVFEDIAITLSEGA